MNMNTTCLELNDNRIELAETGTTWTRRFMTRILAGCLIGLLSFSALLWLGIMLVQFVHFLCPAY